MLHSEESPLSKQLTLQVQDGSSQVEVQITQNATAARLKEKNLLEALCIGG